MQMLETGDAREAKRARIALFSGRSATITVGGASVSGIVRAVREENAGGARRWIVTLKRAAQSQQ